jgi:hypothetical protein
LGCKSDRAEQQDDKDGCFHGVARTVFNEGSR